MGNANEVLLRRLFRPSPNAGARSVKHDLLRRMKAAGYSPSEDDKKGVALGKLIKAVFEQDPCVKRKHTKTGTAWTGLADV